MKENERDRRFPGSRLGIASHRRWAWQGWFLLAGVAVATAMACGGAGDDKKTTAAPTDTTLGDPNGGLLGTNTGAGGQNVVNPFEQGGAGGSGEPCVPQVTSCEGLCGPVNNGCGSILPCGSCPNAGEFCDVDTHTCGPPKITCQDFGAECGQVINTCGKKVFCLSAPGAAPETGCPVGQQCNFDTSKCEACQATTCQALGFECDPKAKFGKAPDGCGDFLTCGECPDGKVCDAIARICIVALQPKPTCAELQAECGFVSDKNGDVLDCTKGDNDKERSGCAAGQACGAAGIPNKCAPKAPTECVALGKNCGDIPSACGGTVRCGDCTNGDVCTDGVCGPPCQPTKTCADLTSDVAQCGTFVNDCNRQVTCNCAAGSTCQITSGATGTCCTDARPDAEVCQAGGKQCGNSAVKDTCGRSRNCGTCPSNGTCNNGTCCSDTRTDGEVCQANNKQCGNSAAKDTCGRSRNCGTCPGVSACLNNQCCTDTRSSADVCGAQACGTKRDQCGINRNCGVNNTSNCAPGAGVCLNGSCCNDARTNAEVCGTRTCGSTRDQCNVSRTCGTCSGSTCYQGACCSDPRSTTQVCTDNGFASKCGTTTNTCGQSVTCGQPQTQQQFCGSSTVGGTNQPCGSLQEPSCGTTLQCACENQGDVCTNGKCCTRQSDNVACGRSNGLIGASCTSVKNNCGQNVSCTCQNDVTQGITLNKCNAQTGTCECKPLTCTEIGLPGLHLDGCGNYVNCTN